MSSPLPIMDAELAPLPEVSSASIWDHAVTERRRFESDNRAAFLECAISSYRKLLDHPGLDICKRCRVLSALGNTLTRLYKQVGGADNVDSAISYLREALSLCVDGDVCQNVSVLVDLAEALCTSFETRGGATLFEEALALSQAAVQLSLNCHPPVYCTSLHELSRILLRSYHNTASQERLEESLQICRQGLQYCSDHCEHHSRALCTLGRLLCSKYYLTSQIELLDEADVVLHYTLCLQPPGNPDRHATLNELSRVSSLRHDRSADPLLLERATNLAKDALSLCPPGHPFYVIILSNLGDLATDRWHITEDIQALSEAVENLRYSLCLRPPGHPERWFSLNNLARALYNTSQHTDSLDSLSEALQLHREALHIYPRGHARYNTSLANFANALQPHHWSTGDLRILDDVITCYRGCLDVLDPRNTLSREVMGQLAGTIHRRFRRLGDVHDLEEAISLYLLCLSHEEANDDIGRSARLAGLSGLLLTRFRQSSQLSHLDDAISYAEKAVVALKGTSITRVHVLGVLGDAYTARFCQTASEVDAVAARAAYDTALGEPETHDRSVLLLRRAHLHLQQDYLSISFALDAIYDGLVDENGLLTDKLEACWPALRQLSKLDLGYLVSNPNFAHRILDIYTALNRILPEGAYLNTGIHSRLRNLRLQDNLATYLIAYGRACNDIGRALELFEESRSLFWTQALCLRAPMKLLPPALRKDMSSLAERIEVYTFESPGSSSLSGRIDSQVAAGEHRNDVNRLKSLIKETRSIPGLSRFMLPDQLPTLMQSARDGPIVLLTCSTLSSDAIILSPSGDLLVLPLPNVTKEQLSKLNDTWDRTVAKARNETRERLGIKFDRRIQRGNPLKDEQYRILRELWNGIVHPVLTKLHLQKSEGTHRPRLWWCCSGEFAFLPVHAAGKGNEWCSNYVVSSYVPNIGALLKARKDIELPRRTDVRAVLGAVSELSLGMTKSEIRDICAVIPPTARLPLPAAEDPLHPDFAGSITTTTIMEHIPNAHILHLACHGTQDTADPLNSGFIFRDGKLTIANLMRTPLPRAFFAFMSACETARGDAEFANQNIHLGAAMLFAGFKSVVGTMWSMDDVDGPIVAKTVYERLFQGQSEYLDPETIPYALDEAVQLLRGRGVSPGRWATYIHLGL